MISDHVKEAVKQQVLKDLADYFAEAEEHEDEEVQNDPDTEQRVEDFYLYTTSVRDGSFGVGIGFEEEV